jgi:hypothetical protein
MNYADIVEARLQAMRDTARQARPRGNVQDVIAAMKHLPSMGRLQRLAQDEIRRREAFKGRRAGNGPERD